MDKNQMITGGEYIAHWIHKKNLKRVFVFPGGTIGPILDPLSKDASVDIFCARHEQGAGYAAIAATKLSASPQIVMVTSGPGVTNILSPLADAYFDNIPLIVLTGQVATTQMRGKKPVKQGGFQETDTIDIARPIAKKVFQILKTEDISRVFDEAYEIATSGRTGPVLIDLPMDIQRNLLPRKSFKYHKSNKQKTSIKINKNDIDKIIDMFIHAKRPVIIAGHGVILSKATEELRVFARYAHTPVAMSMLGIGAFPSTHPLSLGFMGYAGSQYCNSAIYNADLVLAIGTRLDLRQTGTESHKFAPKARIIRVDIDPNELEYTRVPHSIAIQSDAREVLKKLCQSIKKHTLHHHDEWISFITSLKKTYPLIYKKEPLKAQQIIESVSTQITYDKTIVTTGVGQHQNWVPRHFSFDYPKRILLTSGGHGTMGYGLPAAIGAQLTRPDALVVCFDGDGSFQLNIQELAAIQEFNLPIKIFVLDNKRFGIVSEFQLQVWGTDPTCGCKFNPNFSEIAKAYGLKAYTLDDPKHVDSMVKKVLHTKGPALLHCLIDPQEELSPMLLGGQTLDSMWNKPHEK